MPDRVVQGLRSAQLGRQALAKNGFDALSQAFLAASAGARQRLLRINDGRSLGNSCCDRLAISQPTVIAESDKAAISRYLVVAFFPSWWARAIA